MSEDEEFKDLDAEQSKNNKPSGSKPSGNQRFSSGRNNNQGRNQGKHGKKPGNNNRYNNQNGDQEEFVRVRMPRGNQSIGIVEQRLGGSRMRVRCFDGKTRICRIPGRLKRRLWIREGDTLLVEPWEISGDERGDVIFKYRHNQVKVLDKKGLLDNIKDEDEF